jgi:6-pyruvoyltetrahydropterin/6-carboxytetrahydropterin synthase
MIVTARLGFSAAHRLHNPEKDAAWNRETYDKCDNPGGHGHNYVVEVSVAGNVDPVTGMVIDLKKLKNIMRRTVIDRVDHKNLNSDVDFLRGVIPTAENLAMAFWRELSPAIDEGRLTRIVVYETENNSAIYEGDSA